MKWFRFYAEALDDPKVQRLPAALFRIWVNLLCLAAKADGALPDAADIAFALRLSDADAAAAIVDLMDVGLLEADGCGYRPHNWEGRQAGSDSSAERTRLYRERRRQATETSRAARATSNEASRVTSPRRHGDGREEIRGDQIRGDQIRGEESAERGTKPRATSLPRKRGAAPVLRPELLALVTALLKQPPNAKQRKQLAYHDGLSPPPTDAQYRAAIGRALASATGDPIAYAMSFVHECDPEEHNGLTRGRNGTHPGRARSDPAPRPPSDVAGSWERRAGPG